MNAKTTQVLPVFNGVKAGKCDRCQAETKLVSVRSLWLCGRCIARERTNAQAPR